MTSDEIWNTTICSSWLLQSRVSSSNGLLDDGRDGDREGTCQAKVCRQ